MSWQGIAGHDDVVAQFRGALARNRLASTFLFVGPAGIGKRTFALKLAQTLLCQTRPPELMDPCGTCASCQQVLAGGHPDLDMVGKPKDKSTIPVDTFIGDADHRMREGLCHRIGLKPFMGGRKIAVIDDADFLNQEGANCLLKTLEEPPARSVLILIGTSPAKQLPTIRSRCQMIRFRPLEPATVAELLVKHELIADEKEAARLAEYAEGSLERAVELSDPELWKFRAQLFERLADPRLDSLRLAKAVIAFIDEAGKEASQRRSRARQIIGMAAEFYRRWLRSVSGAAAEGDAELQAIVERAQYAHPLDEETIARCLDRTLEALEHIDRNANQATLVECWLDDLWQLTTVINHGGTETRSRQTMSGQR